MRTSLLASNRFVRLAPSHTGLDFTHIPSSFVIRLVCLHVACLWTYQASLVRRQPHARRRTGAVIISQVVVAVIHPSHRLTSAGWDAVTLPPLGIASRLPSTVLFSSTKYTSSVHPFSNAAPTQLGLAGSAPQIPAELPARASSRLTGAWSRSELSCWHLSWVASTFRILLPSGP